jgi:hypothetical protein
MYSACVLAITGVVIILAPYFLIGSGISIDIFIVNICKYTGFFVICCGLLYLILYVIQDIKVFFNKNKK